MRSPMSSLLLWVGLLFLTPVTPGVAQGGTGLASRPESASVGRRLDGRQMPDSAPLRRLVTLDLQNVTLQTALEAIDRQAALGLIYTARVVPLGRRVTVQVEHVPAEVALREVLRGTNAAVEVAAGQIVVVQREHAAPPPQGGAVTGRVTDAKTRAVLAGATVVVEGTRHSATTGSDGRYRITDVAPGTYTVRARYIGYAPGTASIAVTADQEATADFALEKSAQRLDEVVTTGTVVPTEVKALPTPISVITADDIQQQNLQRVDQIFRGQVPGAIALDPGPYDYFSAINVRGASSLIRAPTIKTFIDGVEVADPQYIATIDPNSIDRIEITRGPQASTLYGAGALSGVMQIFTKKGRFGLTRPEVMGKVSAGGIGGFDGQSTTFQTDNAVSLVGGGEKNSYSVGGSLRHVGEWVPAYYSTDWGASAGAQTIQGPLTLSTSLRYADKTYTDAWDTRLQAYTFFSRPDYLRHRLRQQTYGLTANLQATRNWQHTLTLGYDQTRLGYDQTQGRFTTPGDSLLAVLEFYQAKISLLYHTDLSVRLGNTVAAVVTAGINHDAYDLTELGVFGSTRTTGSLGGLQLSAHIPWTNTGSFAQVQVSLAERLFLTGGLRAERNANFGEGFGTAWSPRVGAAYLAGFGSASVKLRASYGESIRAPDPGSRDAHQYLGFRYLPSPNLGPERQRGAEGGLDLYLGRASLGVTYYNQRAIGLIQQVTVTTPADTEPTYQYLNIARVKNEGWEFEAHVPLGPVQLSGTYSITHSTVQQLPPDYPAGDYQVGDRILGVPYSSAGATITYSPLPQTTLTASMTYIGHLTSYDNLASYALSFGGAPYRGSNRAYWIEYPAVTKFAVGVNQRLTSHLTAFARAENLGNTMRPEGGNLAIPTPRSVLVGANVRY